MFSRLWLSDLSTDTVAALQHAGQVEGFSVEFDLLDLLRGAGGRRGLELGPGPMGADRGWELGQCQGRSAWAGELFTLAAGSCHRRGSCARQRRYHGLKGAGARSAVHPPPSAAGGSSAIQFSHQIEEEAESFAIDGGRVELEASGKQSVSMLASSCLPLAF